MKLLLQLAFIIALVFTTSLLFCDASKAGTNTIMTVSLQVKNPELLSKEQLIIQQQILHNARLTYSTITPHYDRVATAELITFKGIKSIEDYNRLEGTIIPFKAKQTTTFFEKANIFNDKLQSWLN